MTIDQATHSVTVKRTIGRYRNWVACCDCGWQDKTAYFYPQYAENRAAKHRRNS